MSEGSGNDQPGRGPRSPAQSAADERPSRVALEQRERWALDQHGVWRERYAPADTQPPRARRRLGMVGWLGGSGVVAVAVILILSQAGVFSSNKAAANTGGFQPTATNPAQAARQTAEAFLTAWRHGQLGKAARYTDHPAAAAAALTSYRDGLDLRALHTAVRSASAQGRVAFSVVATVGLPAAPTAGTTVTPAPSGTPQPAAGPAATATWSYASDLVAYARHGAWWVKWTPALVAPNLTAAERIVTMPIAPGVGEVVDRGGGNLANSSDPGLQHIAALLSKTAPAGQGTPGIEVAFVGPGNRPIAGTVNQLSQPVDAGVLKTTFDPRVEAAARAAVQAHADSSMVVIQPSTGEILAVANNAGGNDFALTARVAPGSTNKIITSTALFTTGLVRSPRQPVDCPLQIDANGELINNAGGESEPPGTPFITDFAASCNNAFDRWYASMGPHTLAQTAEKYYGLNQPWNIGLGKSAPYYIIPASAAKNELALELFGQGLLVTAPLAMASVAATVDAGTFRQPIVVPGQPQLAATPLPPKVHQYLWELMRAVTQPGGTAAGVFSGVGSAVYAKTGTADVTRQGQPNSWMVAFDPKLDVAIGCLVLNAGYGAAVAGPEVASVLQRLP